MVHMMNKSPVIKMKRSKSSNPILGIRSNQTLSRNKSFILDDRKAVWNSQGDQPDLKLDKMYMEAEQSFDQGEFEKALIKFTQGAKLNPNDKSFVIGMKKSKTAIINDLTSTSDILKQLKDEITKYPLSKVMKDEIPLFPPKEELTVSKSLKSLSDEGDMADFNEVKSEVMKAVVTKLKEKKLEPVYNLTIKDGSNYKTVKASAQDVKEYIKNKNYFKTKEQIKKDWKTLRSEFNKKMTEREATQRYEKEAKLLEERSSVRQYCDEQVNLIGRHYQNGKISDVIRFSENFIKYLNKKTEKVLPRKWIYLATTFNYLARANADQEDFEKATTYGEKLYRIAISSNNTELIVQSYILSGKIYVTFEKYKEAAFVWEKLIPLVTDDEKRAWLFHEIGRCYFEMRNYDTSLKHGIESAHWAGKCSSTTWCSAANVLIGQIHMKKKNYKEAMKKFCEAKKHAELLGDDQTLKYISSIQEILSVVLSRGRATNGKERPCNMVEENDSADGEKLIKEKE